MKLRDLLARLTGRQSAADASLRAVERLLGHTFSSPTLLETALTHRSAVRGNGPAVESYERLEFLGDSVLGLIIGDQLYRDHPEDGEGQLTKAKALLVNETTLARIGRDTGLSAHIRVSTEEERAGGKERASIVSDVLEAVIGAVYLDGGIVPARRIVLDMVYARRIEVMADRSQRNYKGDLLELIQSRGPSAPRYDVVSEEGPDHDKLFRVQVLVNGEPLGVGEGSSKKEAEQRAAAVALQRLEGALETDGTAPRSERVTRPDIADGTA